MQDVSTLPVNVGVATHVMTPFPVGQLPFTPDGLSSLFPSLQGSSMSTQPLPSTSNNIKKAMEKAHSFDSVHTNVFLEAYMSAPAQLSKDALLNLRQLCIRSSCDWLQQCQLLSLRLLLAELESRGSGVASKVKPEDSVASSKLRRAFPEYQGKAPSITISNCHFFFVGDMNAESNNEGPNKCIFSAEVSVQNDGNPKCVAKVSETQSFVDGDMVAGDYLGCAGLGERTISRGETTTFRFVLKPPPKRHLSVFEEVVVLQVNKYVTIFVTFIVVSPRQKPFGVGFPRCLAITVRDSPVGVYTSPLILQLLKHQFVRQQGFVNKSIVHLLVGKSGNFSALNREVMREATRVKEMLEEDMNFAEVLATYRSSLPQNLWGNIELPQSSAQPAGYLPGDVLPTAVAAVSSMSCFPNAATKLPVDLTNAQADVLMALILIWLAEMEVAIFDLSLLAFEPIAYLGRLPQHLRGIILWIVDLCGGLLLHKDANGVSLRHLALTFAAVLMRKKILTDERQEDSVFMEKYFEQDVGEGPHADSILTDVALHQAAVNAFVHWITVYFASYEKYRSH